MLEVEPIAVLETNYAYVIRVKGQVFVLDPGEAMPVLKYLQGCQDNITILLTHKHQDHVGGVAEILQVHDAVVYGGVKEDFPKLVMGLDEGVHTISDVVINVLHLPGHTMGAIAYKIGKALFTGDVLFGGGCGRVFEGSSEDMVKSLDKLSMLEDDTQIYFGHEYTKNNLTYAAFIEHNNKTIQERLRVLQQCSTPSLLLIEKETNPFLRLDEPAMIEAVNKKAGRDINDRVERFAWLRECKNQFDAGRL